MVKTKKGQAKIVARARLMQLLGEQLITDEVAAISELVKNAYDADAKQVSVILDHVSEPEIGYVLIRDDGHGMSFEKVISSWLELGTLSKARGPDLTPRLSESGKRVYLGEKGLGRLSVHKLGLYTEIITKRMNSDVETKLILDWTAFENTKKYLDDIPVEWETTGPQLFKKNKSGTQILIKQLQRKWNKRLINNVQRNFISKISF